MSHFFSRKGFSCSIVQALNLIYYTYTNNIGLPIVQ